MNELIGKQEADIALADLSITSDRVGVVDFTEPFMTQGIGILYQSPRTSPPELFTLLKPFSIGVWTALASAFFLTSWLLKVLGRLSPLEWVNEHECTGARTDEFDNQFCMRNALWFCASTLMLQGCDLNPRAVSVCDIVTYFFLTTERRNSFSILFSISIKRGAES